MTYVYILRSIALPERHYVGVTADLRDRLKRHNAGEVSHTSKFAPWEIKTYLAFSDEAQAFAFRAVSEVRVGPRFRSEAPLSPLLRNYGSASQPPHPGSSEGCRAAARSRRRACSEEDPRAILTRVACPPN